MKLTTCPNLHRSPDNLRACADLIHSLHKPGAIAFVGAGVSVEAGYPSWSKLLDDLHEKVVELQSKVSPRELEQIRRIDDLLWRAQEYRRLLDETAFNSLMWEFFRPRATPKAPTATALAQCPFRHYLTTNYDPLLETACTSAKQGLKVLDWTQAPEIQQFLRTAHLAAPHFIYLHGRYNLPQSIVLSERDYVRRYASSDDTSRKLFTLFATQRLVFVGFSLNDPDLAFILRSVNAAFNAVDPQHYLLAPLGENEDEGVHRRKFCGKHGVNPVFFTPGATERYGALPQVLDYLAATSLLAGRSPSAQSFFDTFQEAHRSNPASASGRTSRQSKNPDDPNKGAFGGRNAIGGVSLTAEVSETEEKDWYSVHLVVKASRGTRLGKQVTFHLHPTFPQSPVKVPVAGGEAVWEGYAYGAFTVGVETERGTRLELDLAELPSAPQRFRER